MKRHCIIDPVNCNLSKYKIIASDIIMISRAGIKRT